MKDCLNKVLVVFLMSFMLGSCSHKPADKLVGNDRDDHGCIASAGYRWSEARKDCIRIWEVGERLDNGDKRVFVVFSNDSTIAEVYLDDGRCISCKRENNSWKSKNNKVTVTLDKETLTVHAYGLRYDAQEIEH